MANLSTKEGIEARIERVKDLIEWSENEGDYQAAEGYVAELRSLEEYFDNFSMKNNNTI